MKIAFTCSLFSCILLYLFLVTCTLYNKNTNFLHILLLLCQTYEVILSAPSRFNTYYLSKRTIIKPLHVWLSTPILLSSLIAISEEG
jgi:hypothetical protein